MSVKRRDSKGRILRTGESQRKNGLYQYDYTDEAGEVKSIYAWKLVDTDKTPSGKRDKLSLRQQEKEISENLSRNLQAKPKKVILNEMFERHMGTKRYRTSTKENYLYMWDRHVKNSKIGKMDVTKIRKSHIAQFYAEKSKTLADGTIQVLHKMIYPSLQLAVDDDMIAKNPAFGCCKDYNKKKILKEALKAQEQDDFLEFCENTKTIRKNVLMFGIMLESSVRIGELIGLTWKDINMKERIISINHELLYRWIDGKMKLYIEEVKTDHGERDIPMTDTAFEYFKELYDNKDSHQTLLSVDGYTDFVFVTKNGRPVLPANVNNAIKRVLNKYNKLNPDKPLPNISNHIFRHSGCTRMAENEVEMGTMQYVMGHSDARMIRQVYDHVNFERVRKQMQKMNKQQDSA